MSFVNPFDVVEDEMAAMAISQMSTEVKSLLKRMSKVNQATRVKALQDLTEMLAHTDHFHELQDHYVNHDLTFLGKDL